MAANVSLRLRNLGEQVVPKTMKRKMAEQAQEPEQKYSASELPSEEVMLEIEKKLSLPGWKDPERYITAAGSVAVPITMKKRIPESFVKVCRHEHALAEQSTPVQTRPKLCRFFKLNYKPRVLNLTDLPEE
ncbi:uncharacterized protein LOC6525192 [Drosophila yakuba]|uniref:Uncharacterized protein n=1 Tax=Drosophila yakuba TaxID=7245 RepID=B4PZI2_DROYA|nr:uncharacterized protein LOC6525192 [Drosophila yakuba]EDX02138.2 uncharacterized protein Dyak_GE17388 [Drosophila yakuba]